MESVVVGDLRIAYLQDGPADGRPVVMLHGFPDGPWTFDHLAAAAAAAGLRVIRPWLRGYPPTEVPGGRTVPLDDLVADLDGLAEVLRLESPLLVGHDWGAVIGWAATARKDTPWAAFVALGIPPPPVQARAVRQPAQVLHRSGYMLWMQVPGIERLMPRIAARLYDRWSPGWQVPAAHLRRVQTLLALPGAGRAAAGYYRWIVPAALSGRHPADPAAVPMVPVRYLHGRDDTCFPASAADRSRRHLAHGSVRIVDGAGHFLHLQRPEAVTPDVLDFLLEQP